MNYEPRKIFQRNWATYECCHQSLRMLKRCLYMYRIVFTFYVIVILDTRTFGFQFQLQTNHPSVASRTSAVIAHDAFRTNRWSTSCVSLRASSSADEKSLQSDNLKANTDGEPSSKNNNLQHRNTTTQLKPIELWETLQERHHQAVSENKTGLAVDIDKYDAVLAQCVARNEWKLAEKVLDLKLEAGFPKATLSSYKACLQACFDEANSKSVKRILWQMKEEDSLVMESCENASESSSDCYSLAVLAFCRSYKDDHSWLTEALKIVKSHTITTPAYNAILACLVEERDWKWAIRILRNLQQHQNNNNGEGCITTPDLASYRLVVECCCAARQPSQAVPILQQCIQQELVPTVYTFELAIRSLSRQGQWRRARQLLHTMEGLSVPPTLEIYNTLLQSCSKAREALVAKQLLKDMRRYVVPNVRCYNAVLSACASDRRMWKDALQIFDQCHREPTVQPDIYTYTNAMRACAKAGKTRKALTMLQVIKDKGLPLDAYAYTAAIEACSKSRMSRKALELLKEMQDANIAPTGVTYSVAITACGNSGDWKQALKLLDTMQQEHLSINVITYNSAITAISKAAKMNSKQGSRYGSEATEHGELYLIVLDILDDMREAGIKPDGFSFSAAISCCGAEGRWKEALELIKVMQDGGSQMRPNKVAYTAAIASCGRSGKIDEAVNLFRQMKKQGLSPDLVAYNALFSAIRIAKQPDQAYDLWVEMVGITPAARHHSQVGANKKVRPAKGNSLVTPDIISVTDAIAALSSGSDTELDRKRIDEVFQEAVRRGIVLGGNWLDTHCEIDLSGLTLPVGRAALRYVLSRIQQQFSTGKGLGQSTLTLITGIGAQHKTALARSNHAELSLRDHVQSLLQTEYNPPIKSHIPKLAKGTVEIHADEIRKWLEFQSTRK